MAWLDASRLSGTRPRTRGLFLPLALKKWKSCARCLVLLFKKQPVKKQPCQDSPWESEGQGTPTPFPPTPGPCWGPSGGQGAPLYPATLGLTPPPRTSPREAE